MYEIAKGFMWVLIGLMVIFVITSIGQLIEVKNPGSAISFNIASTCFVGSFLLAIACAIYDSGIKAGREDQEIPPELLDKKE